MTKRILAVMLACMMVLSIASFTAIAEENAYYVEFGNSNGDGSKDDPFGTIDEAIAELGGEDGTVYIIGSYDMSLWEGEAWDGMVTIAGANKKSKITLEDSKSAVFHGDVTFKDIKFEIGQYTHFNPMGTLMVWDAGADSDFPCFFHLGTYGGETFDEANYIHNSGRLGSFSIGGYNTEVSNGVAGDANFTINGGEIGAIHLHADSYMDQHVGISIGNNLNIVVNGGTIGAFAYNEARQPEIYGALNIIFNNGIEAPDEFAYPETAIGGTYIIKSGKGGKVLPTEDAGVFTVKADAGKIAKINGVEYPDGEVTLEAGKTEVKWVKGEQKTSSVIKLTIDKAEIVKDGVATALDVPAQIINDRTMVPLRAIFEALGATVEWNNETRTVTSAKGDTKISLTIDDTNLYVNGEAKVLDVPAQIVNDRTMVPARAIAEAYGCQVEWDGETRTVTITG